MKVSSESMLVYAVTDRTHLGDRTLKQQVEEALRGGATFVQLREKDLPADEFLAEAVEIRDVCRKYGVPFVINDNVSVALACDADGVHVGQEDMKAQDVRALLGPDKIIGVSAHNAEEAREALRCGADYLGAGAVFATGTKTNVTAMSRETLTEICAAVDIPVVAIGGISVSNMEQLAGTGVDGVAVVSAIFSQKDARAAAEALRKKAEELFGTK